MYKVRFFSLSGIIIVCGKWCKFGVKELEEVALLPLFHIPRVSVHVVICKLFF